MTEDTYNGWTNRETWAVALHINNDQGWQEQVFADLREADPKQGRDDLRTSAMRRAGDAIRENVENYLDVLIDVDVLEYRNVVSDIGSLWRVNWTELGAAFLADLAEQQD